MIEISVESPDQPEVQALLVASDAYMASLYPAESNHMVDVTTLMKPNVTFLVARAQGRVVGCGASVKMGDDWSEIKRMFVSPAGRGQQSGRKLLLALEMAARGQGATVLRLETGIRQPEALGLYRSAGFKEIAPFGNYKPDPLSLFMEKAL
jgi:putative acetyltransferase